MKEKNISFEPLWADSLGAKSMATLVETPDVSVLLDPGVAVMQPSFPASWAKKFYWKGRAWLSIGNASQKADIVVITHYHYDHFTDFDVSFYEDKLLLVKNPNEYINNSQMDRARDFLGSICKRFGDRKLEEFLEEVEGRDYSDPMDEIPHSRDKDFGDYNERRQDLLEKWSSRYYERVENWLSSKWVPELNFENLTVKFPEERKFKFGKTNLRFTKPRFHGIELANTGWVFCVVVERDGEKFLYTSDLQGPTVEDYADWIIRENPDVLYLDGPATYLLGYMLNRTNLNRAVDNAVRIVEGLDSAQILYDHHLAREKKFRERTKKVGDAAEDSENKISTVAEYKGKRPVVLE